MWDRCSNQCPCLMEMQTVLLAAREPVSVCWYQIPTAFVSCGKYIGGKGWSEYDPLQWNCLKSIRKKQLFTSSAH